MTLSWLTKLSTSWRRYPIAVLGYVQGPIRWETFAGLDRYVGESEHLWMIEPRRYADCSTDFAVTHLQKKSRFGFLIMWPFCVHAWFTFRFQEQKLSDGNVMVDVTGSERVLYWRAGIARWDAHDGIYICPTWYGPGLHWD